MWTVLRWVGAAFCAASVTIAYACCVAAGMADDREGTR